MTNQAGSRVHYFDKQFLRVNEFTDEQLYQLAARRRHNVTEHAWGIVSGLDLAQESDGGLVVRPGVAIDGYGREVLLTDKKSLAPQTFDDLGTDRLDAWIVYDRRDDANVPSGYGSCVPGAAGAAYRSDEVPQILLERSVGDVVDPRRPPGVPTSVLDAQIPQMSDDPKDIWRVYLGRIIRLGAGQYSVDGTQRTYVGLVGETVDHPANATRLEVGKQSLADVSRVVDGVTYVYQKGEDPQRKTSRRFAVFVPEDITTADQQQSQTLAPRLEILGDGTIRMRGQTVVNGSLRIAGGALQFVDAADFTVGNAPSDPSVYRVKESGDDQLRVDLGTEGTLNRQFVIGFSSADGSFTTCLKLELKDTTGSGTMAPVVTIFGDLKVDGQLIGQYVPRTLSQEALAALLGSFQSGVAAGNAGH
jgi:hypothetical protein